MSDIKNMLNCQVSDPV